MHERDLESEEALARGIVDQVGSGVGQVCEGRLQIPDLVGDVVHAGPALRQEPADRGVGAERLEQLDAPVTDSQGRRADSLLVHRRAMLDLGAKKLLVRLQRLIEVVDSDAEMMDALRPHADEATARAEPPDLRARGRYREAGNPLALGSGTFERYDVADALRGPRLRVNAVEQLDQLFPAERLFLEQRRRHTIERGTMFRQ